MFVAVCVTVAVVVMRVAIDHIRRGRLAAAVDRGAVGDLKLDRRVVDAEVIAELVVQPLEHRLALTQLHLDHLHVTGERV